MSTAERIDPRSERTRRALRRVLFDLLFEQGWEAVNVRALCDRAGIGRSTFYLHFADKEDLLLSGFDELHRELRAVAATEDGAPLAFVRPLIEHVRTHDRVRCLVEKQSGHTVLRRLTQLVVELMQEEVARLAPPSARRTAAAQYLAGSFVQLLFWWLNTRSRLTPAELAQLYRKLSLPVLRTLRRVERKS
ncbi:MAG TPA: TetR/AcrR family transcriptional regulator [Polyangiaceae bacterium]